MLFIHVIMTKLNFQDHYFSL